MQWLWTWSGTSFGYRDGDELWTHDGRHAGRFDGHEVYAPSGRYLGELINNRLITNRRNEVGAGARSLRIGSAPATRGTHAHAGYAMYAGHEDFPAPDNL